MDWYDALTPWPAPRIFQADSDFGGSAPSFLKTLEDNIIPLVESSLPAQDNAPAPTASLQPESISAQKHPTKDNTTALSTSQGGSIDPPYSASQESGIGPADSTSQSSGIELVPSTLQGGSIDPVDSTSQGSGIVLGTSPVRCLVGISLSGLFAIWASYHSDFFHSIALP